MATGNFIITNFVPNPAPIPPSFVQVTGSGIGSLTTLTVVDFPTTGSPPINLTFPIGVIFASQVEYTNLCNCLNNMGSGTVQLTITYTLVNGYMIVTDISCVDLPSEIDVIETLALQNAAALQAISQGLSELTSLVKEALGIPLVDEAGRRAPKQSGFPNTAEEDVA